MKRVLHLTNLISMLITFVLISTLVLAFGDVTAAAPAWDGNNTAYAVGDVVSYEGQEYRCIQAHTSQPDWTPAAVASLWEPTGGTSPTNTPEPTDPPVTPTPTDDPGVTPTPVTPTPTPPPGASEQRIIGYFVDWGIYGRNYLVKNIKTSGSAEKLTHINYAFANVVNNECKIGDSFAAYDKAFTAEESVDGVADTWDGSLRGNFNQLRKLKEEYPNIKVMISLGGWTWSSGFSDAALPQNRVGFVQSCVDLFITDPRWEGVFDGIDVDWEYPGACGNTCNFRPEDTENFTALLAEFRKQLDDVRPGLLLTIAAPAGPDKIDKIEVGEIHKSLDFINLMTYDFHGAWENTTNFQSSLYEAAGDPSPDKFSVEGAAELWLQGGTPANKLVIGVPFYGRGWQGVSNTNNGLWQPASGAAPGTYEAGIEDYKVLKGLGFTRYFDEETQAAWIYGNGQFWTYDDPAIMKIKMDYIKANGLGGAMFWELSGDTSDGELISALYNNR